MEKKINVLMLVAGAVMIVISLLNYMLNEDHVSLGFFFFMGAGFITLGFKEKYDGKRAKRLNKYAMTLFFAAIIIIIYWFGSAKLELF